MAAVGDINRLRQVKRDIRRKAQGPDIFESLGIDTDGTETAAGPSEGPAGNSPDDVEPSTGLRRHARRLERDVHDTE